MRRPVLLPLGVQHTQLHLPGATHSSTLTQRAPHRKERPSGSRLLHLCRRARRLRSHADASGSSAAGGMHRASPGRPTESLRAARPSHRALPQCSLAQGSHSLSPRPSVCLPPQPPGADKYFPNTRGVMATRSAAWIETRHEGAATEGRRHTRSTHDRTVRKSAWGTQKSLFFFKDSVL